jgi:small-conductance mechanosensitive channel
MEFDELKMIWNAQEREPIFVMKEADLQKRIYAKRRQGLRITNFSELLGIIVYLFTAGVVLFVSIAKRHSSPFMYVLAAWLFVCSVYVICGRVQRTRSQRVYDRTLRGELDQAIDIATHQVQLSYLMRWNALPIAMLTILALWDTGKSVWAIAGLAAFFALTNYASGWEHNIYRSKKKELEVLREKLAAPHE